jgi:amidohydrolase
MDIIGAKKAVCDAVDDRADLLLAVSHQIHQHPEENFAEHFAHDLLTRSLESDGLTVERGAYGLDTAFETNVGSAGPTIAVLLEYDALPGIGHACGHNVIAAAGLGAGLAAAVLAEELGGRIRILGTPAEEGGGGKILMADAGAFRQVDAALMIHPADHDIRSMTTIAIHRLDVTYSGLAAHAAAHPWLGRNALDGAVLGYMNVAALRQHIRPDERVHGIFTDGGDKPNIVPATAAMHWYVRAGSLRNLEELKPRVLAALEAGAGASGCTFEHRWIDPAYAELCSNSALEDLYVENAKSVGRIVGPVSDAANVVGSTDMGNVSHLVPSIHPMLGIAPPGVGIHTPRFAEFALGEEGDRGVIDGAKIMAMTIVDLWSSNEALGRVREEFAATAT